MSKAFYRKCPPTTFSVETDPADPTQTISACLPPTSAIWLVACASKVGIPWNKIEVKKGGAEVPVTTKSGVSLHRKYNTKNLPKGKQAKAPGRESSSGEMWECLEEYWDAPFSGTDAASPLTFESPDEYFLESTADCLLPKHMPILQYIQAQLNKSGMNHSGTKLDKLMDKLPEMATKKFTEQTVYHYYSSTSCTSGNESNNVAVEREKKKKKKHREKDAWVKVLKKREELLIQREKKVQQQEQEQMKINEEQRQKDEEQRQKDEEQRQKDEELKAREAALKQREREQQYTPMPEWITKLDIDDDLKPIFVQQRITEAMFEKLSGSELEGIGFPFGTRKALMEEINRRKAA